MTSGKLETQAETKNREGHMPRQKTKEELEERIDELESENEALQDQVDSMQDRLDSINEISAEEEEEEEKTKD
jgi:chaperonin cofactor prefoldin